MVYMTVENTSKHWIKILDLVHALIIFAFFSWFALLSDKIVFMPRD